MKKFLFFLFIFSSTILYSQVDSIVFDSNQKHYYDSVTLIKTVDTINHIVFKEKTIEINYKPYGTYLIIGYDNADVMIKVFVGSGNSITTEDWVLLSGTNNKKAIAVFRDDETFMYWQRIKKVKRI